ncbi:MAG: type II secretion system GspH family protein [candidate division Zixibacteria bacterium]|nr:type II secretion system GspH family protein [candidate division Zixibacteria bacterium]
MKSKAGFTLVELVLIIVVLGIVAAVAIPKIGDVISGSKTSATKEEMLRLKGGIMGNPSVSSSGRFSDRGYRGDVGSFPPSLTGLVVRPGGVAVWNPYTRLGWHGPYIDSTGGDYLNDAWGVNYVYDSTARTITSTGSGTNIVISF